MCYYCALNPKCSNKREKLHNSFAHLSSVIVADVEGPAVGSASVTTGSGVGWGCEAGFLLRVTRFSPVVSPSASPSESQSYGSYPSSPGFRLGYKN